MLAFAPVGILLLAVLSISGLQRLRPSRGYAWLIGTSAALGALGVMLYLRWRLPQQVVVAGWLPFTQFTDTPMFGLDGTSWPYAFCLTAISAAVMLTASARLSQVTSAWTWVGALFTAALGLMAVYSANLLTIVLTWTAIDLLEVVILSGYSGNRALGVQTVIAFAARVSGMVLVILATLINRSQGLAPTFSSLPPLSALLLLLAAGLRLGVLPLNLQTLPEIRLQRGLGTVLRMSSSAASMVVLARIPAQTFSPNLTQALLALSALAVGYAAVNWLGARDEIAGRQFWVITLAGLVVFATLQGSPGVALAWGVALLLSGSLIFLYSARARGLIVLPLLGLLGFSALPFTPAAAGWQGIFVAPLSGWQFVLLGAHILLMLGYLRHMIRAGDGLRDMERWVQSAYPLGLAILILAQWVVGLIGWPGSFTLGVWWSAAAGGAGFVLAGALSSALVRRGLAAPLSARFYLRALRRAGEFITLLFSLRWLYNLLWLVYRRLEQAVHLATTLLEGDGGVLWVLVLLALFISLIRERFFP